MSKKKATVKTSQSIVDWCDEQVKNGHELKIVWEGGNDSGWVHFEIDGKEVDNEYTEKLVDKMYNDLNYGSWAGDFDARGNAIYESKQKAFIGEDIYEETNDQDWSLDAIIRIPKSLWFDVMNVNIEGNDSENPNVTVDLRITNGFLTKEHTKMEEEIQANIEDKLEYAIYSFSKNNQFRGVYLNETYRREDFNTQKDELVLPIESVSIASVSNADREINLEVENIEL